MRPDELVPGNCYFQLGYYDNDLLLPLVQTWIYVGSETFQDEGETWLFKEPEPPSDSEHPTATSEPEPMFAMKDQDLHQLLDFDGLIRQLRAVAQDHPLHPAPVANIAPAGDAELATLPDRVSAFLQNQELSSVTITIRFTDDGFSLSRSDQEITIGFFTHPRLDAFEDQKILSLLNSIGGAAIEDRLFDRGRTRHLEFALSRDADAIVQLCRRVLIEVYAMRRGDELSYSSITHDGRRNPEFR